MLEKILSFDKYMHVPKSTLGLVVGHPWVLFMGMLGQMYNVYSFMHIVSFSWFKLLDYLSSIYLCIIT